MDRNRVRWNDPWHLPEQVPSVTTVNLGAESKPGSLTVIC